MTLGIDHSLPRWLIDDTADITNGRVFVVHTQAPRFIGELLPEDEATLDGVEISGLPFGQVLTRILWFDEPEFEIDELCRSLIDALLHHDGVRGDSST